jgi:hypothetical protein
MFCRYDELMMTFFIPYMQVNRPRRRPALGKVGVSVGPHGGANAPKAESLKEL